MLSLVKVYCEFCFQTSTFAFLLVILSVLPIVLIYGPETDSFGGLNHVLFAQQVSISPTFYEQLFHTTVFIEAFLYAQFGFVIFGEIVLAQKQAIQCW
jgi:hypothetical protein